MKYEQIRDSIKESGRRLFWYGSNSKLLVVGPSKTITRIQIKNTKYEGLLYRLSITFHKGDKLGQGGPIAVRCAKFNLEDNTLRKIKDKQNGIIWFDKEWLETQRKWNDNWLNLILLDLIDGFKFGFGIDMYPLKY
jgi:hypothetical protein